MAHASEGGTNRLIHETSPYLRQHAHNPVDWHPWGDEAFELARREEKPVFLSIGYSTCHWCHVMERESFENAEIAERLNRHFISIKVDREERPDLDELYMNATQLMAGRGGWPNSVWLTPDGRPWYAGTYFPPEPRGGLPGFGQLLTHLAAAWRDRRPEVEAQATQLADALKRIAEAPPAAETRPGDVLHAALADLARRFDPDFGGFDDAPKFPPHGTLALLAHVARPGGPEAPMRMLIATLDGMEMGGIRDHLGGGFHRYSTDARWFLPHFEKMLYDNALLLRAYADGFRLTGDAEYRRVAAEIAAWVLREMTSPEGGFYSALDADTEGREGGCYLWTLREIRAALGDEEGEFFRRVYGAEEQGNFADEAAGRMAGENVLYLRAPLEKLLRAEGVEVEEGRERLDAMRGKLMALRERRPRLHRDEKILMSWNGLMLGALAQAGRALSEPEFISVAARAAEFVLGRLRSERGLLHSYCEGEAKLPAFLDDRACLADGLLDLHEATGDGRWLSEASEIAESILDHHSDPSAGGFFLTPDEGEALLARWKPAYDQPLPSGNAVAARVFARLGRISGEREWFERASRTIRAFASLMRAAPQGVLSLILAATELKEAGGDGGAMPSSEIVSIRAEPPEVSARPGEAVELQLRVIVAEGYHVIAGASSAGHEPVRVHLSETSSAVLEEVRLPPGRPAEIAGEEVQVLDGEFPVLCRLRVSREIQQDPHTLSLEATLQPCTDRECLPSVHLALMVRLTVVGGQ
jgi:hypothetical protein